MRTLLPVWFALFAASAVLAQGQINNFAQPIATTVQLPTFGVSFDAAGVLQLKTFTDPSGRLIAERAAAARAALPGDLGRRVELRKVSIVRLQSVVSAAIRDGRGPDDVMQKLAGLTRVTAIFCYPDTGDIVIAGPAEPWAEDLSSTAIGIHSGRPTLLLADLVVALLRVPTQFTSGTVRRLYDQSACRRFGTLAAIPKTDSSFCIRPST